MKSETKTSIFFLIISIILPLLFILLFLYDNTKIPEISLDEMLEISDITEYGIETAEIIDGNIVLKGWLIETPNTISRIDRNFILSDGNTAYKLNTIMQTRNDITERWNDGNNYDNSGLEGNGAVKYLDRGHYCIGFLINDNDQNHYYLTDEYLEVY